MCYIQVKNIRLNSFYEEKKIKLCLTKQLLNMFKLWCEWGISLKVYEANLIPRNNAKYDFPVRKSVLRSKAYFLIVLTIKNGSFFHKILVWRTFSLRVFRSIIYKNKSRIFFNFQWFLTLNIIFSLNTYFLLLPWP